LLYKEAEMKTYDFGIAKVYSKDDEFVKILRKELEKRKLSFYEINYFNVSETIKMIDENILRFKIFLDLSSFENPVFGILLEKLNSRGIKVINSSESFVKSFSKSELHKLFKKNNLPVRKTFIINSKNHKKEELNKIPGFLKKPFVLSQSVTSLEHAIVLNAKDPGDIINFLNDYPTEDCLAQEYVVPSLTEGKVSWFRVIYACGKIISHWWDPQNSFYLRFKNSKTENKIRKKIEPYMNKIAEITGLKLFSTEFVIRQNEEYVIIDYANNPIDLSSQDDNKDGVPMETLNEIARAVANLK